MEAVFEKTIDTNLKSAFFVTQAALPLMKTRPKPKIVNVVSAIDTPETELNAAFAASHNALIGMTKSLAKSLPKKFRGNAVAASEKETVSENLDRSFLFVRQCFGGRRDADDCLSAFGKSL